MRSILFEIYNAFRYWLLLEVLVLLIRLFVFLILIALLSSLTQDPLTKIQSIALDLEFLVSWIKFLKLLLLSLIFKL
jgi:hypothetical protein